NQSVVNEQHRGTLGTVNRAGHSSLIIALAVKSGCWSNRTPSDVRAAGPASARKARKRNDPRVLHYTIRAWGLGFPPRMGAPRFMPAPCLDYVARAFREL
ncbi:hypothetical protein K0M31_003574, partial [Melipona bicolor]